jgi:hypothetical protein
VNGKKRPVYAHRLSWEFTFGPVPDGQEVLHRCDVPLCVNPAHLFLGSQQDNLTDARTKGRLDETLPRTTSKLTPEDRLDIFKAKGYRGINCALAARYGVTEACISHIRKGRFRRGTARVQPITVETALQRAGLERVRVVHLPVRGEVR